jgi:hypothetical protein
VGLVAFPVEFLVAFLAYLNFALIDTSNSKSFDLRYHTMF